MDYPDDAFDYVILSQTLQATRRPRVVLEHMLRIGRRAIVSFPNFGHWRIRLKLLLKRRDAGTENLPDAWYDSPNIHFCTIKDFRELCQVAGGRWKSRWRSTPGALRCGSTRHGGSGTCSANRRYSC